MFCCSFSNFGKECPTLWRIYQYVTDEDRVKILQTREEKKKLGFGKGGEGYIASELCCYNCGNTGHLGDVCVLVSPNSSSDKVSGLR
jgi:protein AIR1/2